MTQPPTGPSEPYSLSSVLPVSQPPKKPWRWIVPVAIVTALVTAAAITYVAWTLIAAPTPLRAAYSACGQPGEIADNDRTLVLDTPGKSGGMSTADLADVACVLKNLEAPTYVTAKLEQTSAMSGQVSEEWDGIQATWTYHPDRGLALILHLS